MAATQADPAVIEAGNVKFTVEDRRVGGDGGPAIMVFASVDGAERQLLRFDCFDCFAGGPHYHYDPDGKDEFLRLGEDIDSSAFALGHIEHNLQPMIRLAGYPDVAAAISRDELAQAVPKLRAAVQSISG
jgi:hypothetical protein